MKFLLSSPHSCTAVLSLTPAIPFQTMSQRTTAHNAVQFASGHTSKNTDLLKEALDTMGMRTNGSNQRLAMLGDALPKIVLLDSWYAGGTAKGLLMTPTLACPVFHGIQAMVTTGSHPSEATPIWPSSVEMPASTSMPFFPRVTSAEYPTRLLRRPSKQS